MSRTARLNRRIFLQRTGGTLAAVTIAGTSASGRVLGANDRVRVAMVGVNGRGVEHLQCLCRLKKDVEIAYIVDTDSRLFAQRTKMVHDRTGFTPKCVQDLKQALDDDNIDAVSIATPNHWHTLQGIWACQAKKDVYVEKPCSHTVFEGRKLAEAARKYGRIVQHGTQSRSSATYIAEIAAVRSGKYGKLLVAYAYAGKIRSSIGFKEFKEPPKELNFDLWLGPAPQQPYHENIVPYNWHWFWDFGNGEIGNQGVHQADIARWALPDGAAPKSVMTFGGRFAWKDQGQTPNTLFSVIDCGGPRILVESRDMVNDKISPTYSHNEFYTDEGIIKRGKFYAKGKNKGEPLSGTAGSDGPVDLTGKVIGGKVTEDMSQLHFNNFIECVRSRKPENLKAEILEGHRSSMLTHLANISYRLGKQVPLIHPVASFGDDIDVHEAWASMKQHLVDCDVKLDDAMCQLGPKLEFDAASEQFIGNDDVVSKANKLLTQPYRKNYVVPDEV